MVACKCCCGWIHALTGAVFDRFSTKEGTMLSTNIKESLPLITTVKQAIQVYLKNMGAWIFFTLASLVSFSMLIISSITGFWAGFLGVLGAGVLMCYVHAAIHAVNSEHSLGIRDFTRGWFYLPKTLIVFLIFFFGLLAIYGGFSYFIFGTKLFSFVSKVKTGSVFHNEMNQWSSLITQTALKLLILFLFSIFFGLFSLWMLVPVGMLPFVIVAQNKGLFASIVDSFSIVKGERIRILFIDLLAMFIVSIPFLLSIMFHNVLSQNSGVLTILDISLFAMICLFFPLTVILKAQAHQFLSQRLTI